MRKFWTYVRIAQARYFNMIFWFFTFPGVFYGLVLDELPFLRRFFPSFLVFFAIFTPTYLLATAWIGNKEFQKGSILEEIKLTARLNPVNQMIMDCFRFQTELIQAMLRGEPDRAVSRVEKITEITENWLEVLS